MHNVLTALADIIIIVISGLLIAFSPMLIIVDLLIVLRSKRPILHTLVLLTSIVVPLLIVAFIAGYLVTPDSAFSLRGISSHVSLPGSISVALGVVILLYSAKRFNGVNKQNIIVQKPASSLRQPPTKIWPLFVFGSTKTLLSVTNIFAILFVVRLTETSKLSTFATMLTICAVILIGLIPFFVLLFLHHSRKDFLLDMNDKIDRIITRNIQLVITLLLAFCGSVFVVKGLIEAFTR